MQPVAVAVAEQLAGHPDQVRQLFDAKAPTWSAKYAPEGRLASRLSSLIAALHRHVPVTGSMLDLGCGTGELARAAAAAGMRVTACDVSAEMVRRAASRDPRRTIAWVQLDPCWRTLPFEAAAFDAVVAASVLEYVDEPCVVLRECARILRPGGLMMCTVPDSRHPVRWLEWAARLLAGSRPARAMNPGSEKLGHYLIYLRVSRQRHFARWWDDAAEQAGLTPVIAGVSAQRRAPLRLLAFRRADQCANPR